jgi:hypothetical protein
MNWNEFLKPTKQKLTITFWLIFFFFFLINLQNSIGRYFTPSYFAALDSIEKTLPKQPEMLSGIFTAFLTSVLVVIIFYYLTACVIVNAFKKGRK